MKNVSSGKTRRSHHRRSKKNKDKKKKYVKFTKRLKKKIKLVPIQSHNELKSIITTPINSPMSDE